MRRAWLPGVLYVAAALALLFPAFLNRFPLVMGDTWRYVQEAGGTYSWVSSQFYGYFLRLFLGSSLWLAVAAQALLVLYVTDAFFRRVCAASRVQSPLLIALLGLTTPASFFSSLVMTDVMFGAGLVAATVLLVGKRSVGSDITLAAIVAFAAAAHPAALPLLILIALLGLTFALGMRIRRGIWGEIGRIGLIAGAVAGALVALVVNNAIIWDDPSPNPHGAVVAFVYLLSHGDLEDELDGCTEWQACAFEERPGPGIVNFNRFLFRRNSPLQTELGGPPNYADEAQEIVLAHVTSDPMEYLKRVYSSGRRQLFMVRAVYHVESHMARLAEGHSERVSTYSSGDVARFEAGQQFNKQLDLRPHSNRGVFVGWLGAAAAASAGIAWAASAWCGRIWPERRRRIAGGTLLLLGMYVLHAFVIGTSTYPAQRYGGRVLWLLGLAFWAWALELGRTFAARHRSADTDVAGPNP